LRLGNEAEVYAESILKACKFCVESPLSCVSGVAGSNLKRRIVRIMNLQLTEELTFGRKLLLAVTGSAAVIVPVLFGVIHASQVSAQTMGAADALSAAAGAPAASFDSVSVKASHSTEALDHMEIQPYIFIDSNVTLRKLIAFAYGINEYQITGAPGWIDSERYDIEARWKDSPAVAKAIAAMPGPPPPPVPPGAPKNHLQPFQLQAMLQTVLAQRFNLKFTHESKDLPIYELVVASTGAKLTETPKTPPPPSFNGEQVISVRTMIRGGKGELNLSNGPVGALAGFLSGQLDRQVVDKTGIKGNYDVDLHWLPDEDAKASISESLEQQVGLRLEAQHGLVKVMIVYQVEQPVED
jgi:bla regulator protein BlaR1